jgi:ABC-type proline/glycine betaine transport system permease subunit
MQLIPFYDHAFLADISRRISPCLTSPWFTFTLAAIIIFIYILDLNTPLGVPVWLLYFIPLTLSFWLRPYFAIPTVCIVTLLFLAAGYIFSPPGIQTYAALFNRVIFSVVFIGVSIILWKARRHQYRGKIPQKSKNGIQ